ncbi:MAG TPA: alpha/beta fold hydrolase [Terriglobales bacterium]|nr:alpha/beta fold hydrolase [Terriglobales bacterium]
MDTQSRGLADIKKDILRRAGKINPFERVLRTEVEELLGRLTSLDPEPWGREWGKLGARYEALGREAEEQGGPQAAASAYSQAYEYYRVGRYPVPSSPEKMNCYQGVLRTFLKAAPYRDPPIERVEIPFEGKKIVGYLQLPKGVKRPAIVIHWGGVDGWKEDRRTNGELLHREGWATFTMDMPGTGENPLLGTDPRAERTFSAAIDYLQQRAEVDGGRIACMGSSFGGYWAAKLAHVEVERLRAAVNWGAGVHWTFQERWLRPALTVKASQYLLGPASLLDARAYVLGVRTLEEVLRLAPRLSLKTQGILDQPSAPLLCINGKLDDQHPVEDIYLLLEHGGPKDARIMADGGHMGRRAGQRNDEVQRIVIQWLKQRLS